MERRSSSKAASALNCKAVSPALLSFSEAYHFVVLSGGHTVGADALTRPVIKPQNSTNATATATAVP